MPASYTVGKNGYAFVATITILIVLFVAPSHLGRSRWLSLGLLAYLLGVILVLIFFRSFKLDVRTGGISYASFFGKEQFVAFADISTVCYFRTARRDIATSDYPSQCPAP